MQNVHFTPPELAPLFEVNVSTIKRWIDRGLLKADVTSGKHRRVSQKQLMDFIKENPKNSKNSYVLKRLMQNYKEISNDVWKKYYKYLLENNSAKAEKMFDKLFLKGFPVIEILENVITPTLKHIGDQWEKKVITIYDEHKMSFLIRMHLMKLDQFLPQVKNKNAPKAILACAPGEQHEIPIQIVALVLKQQKWNTNIVGINISIKELIKAADKIKPELISISKTYNKKDSDKYFERLIGYSKKNNICLALGGSAWKNVLAKKKWRKNNCINYFSSLSEFKEFLEKKWENSNSKFARAQSISRN